MSDKSDQKEKDKPSQQEKPKPPPSRLIKEHKDDGKKKRDR